MKRENNHILTYILLVFGVAFWGISFVWFNIANKYYGPMTIIFLRLLLSSLILIPFLGLIRKELNIEKGHIKYFLLLALAEPFLYFIGESTGLTMVSPTVASVIISTIPLVAPFAARAFNKEKISANIFIGIAISLIGIAFMIIGPDFSIQADLGGVALLFLAVFAATAYSVLVKKIPEKYSALQIVTLQNAFGAVYFLPLFLIFEFNHFTQVKPNFELVSVLLQLTVFASILAFAFFTNAVKKIGVAKSSIFSYIIPIFTAIAAYFLINEQFTSNKIIGIALVLSGVVFSQFDSLKRTIMKR